ncbi:MAG: diaminopimelate decarboxylase, partial [Gammaproteobacteria bacterium]|nr:diaminopimelate decarboxylase [Gammaproteobacteria bacterium]
MFSRTDNALHVEDVRLTTIADAVGTPAYVYSQSAIEERYRRLAQALDGASICYSVKANSNLAILRLMGSLGAGFDIVSAGELERVLLAGGDPERVIF